ncbi:hypothetical protein ACWIGW_17990 [Nocardia brasiliensis]
MATVQGSAAAATLRNETCKDFLAVFNAAKQLDPSRSPELGVQEFLASAQQHPDFQALSAAERVAYEDGLRDAAAGACR